MSFETSTFKGDEIYTVNTTGDCVVGDEVCFERATFTGSFRNATFSGFELVKGVIVNDSYGRDKQQHTFTITLLDDSKIKIKGRNLYKNGVFRKPWTDESKRRLVADEKHVRGSNARHERELRLEEDAFFPRHGQL